MSQAFSKFNPANSGPGKKVGEAVERTANKPGTIMLGRLGYAAKGVVYIMVGGLAAFAALGNGGETTDRKGAIEALYGQPAGAVILAVVAFGLACYALWSFIKALADTENDGTDPKGIGKRLVFAGVGVSYLLFAIGAIQLLLGAGNAGKDSDTSAKDWTAELMSKPFGMFLVIAAGLIVLGVAAFQFYKAYKAKFKEHLELGQMSQRMKDWVIGFGRFGHAARGAVFGIIGFFLIIAALQKNPGEARGLGGALNELSRQAYGQILLGLVAFGLVAYGLYSLAEARYRRMIENGGSSKN